MPVIQAVIANDGCDAQSVVRKDLLSACFLNAAARFERPPLLDGFFVSLEGCRQDLAWVNEALKTLKTVGIF